MPSFFTASSVLVLGVFSFWHQDQSRRTALLSVSRLASDLANPCGAELLDTVVMPIAFRSQTPAEQEEFVAKALADEISQKGVHALKHHAEFGSAKSIFPAEYAGWCRRAGVNPDNCVAFKMERSGVRAEVLLVREGKITVSCVATM
jgi:stress-induced morphogen